MGNPTAQGARGQRPAPAPSTAEGKGDPSSVQNQYKILTRTRDNNVKPGVKAVAGSRQSRLQAPVKRPWQQPRVPAPLWAASVLPSPRLRWGDVSVEALLLPGRGLEQQRAAVGYVNIGNAVRSVLRDGVWVN